MDIIKELNELSDSQLTELQTILKIDEDMRVHMSKNPIYKLEQKEYLQLPGSKPNGLWYGFGKEWIDWIETGMPHWKGVYIYEVYMDKSNILKIKGYSQIEDFTKEYILKDGQYSETYFIDWKRVSLKYDGIEINPYMWKYRLELGWYYGWDVASGCVWNLDKVKIERL